MAITRIGIIGVGGFGLFCLQAYRQMPGVAITAIAGTHAEKYARLAAEYDIPFHTTDWRALVAHPAVDIVYLATPPNLRAAPAQAAAAAGKHLLCEKPLALTLAEADAMLAAAARYGTRVSVNFLMRYSALYRCLHTLIGEALLGRPQRLVFENYAGDLPPDHWFWKPEISGGIPVEHGVHFFDAFHWLLGDGALRWAECLRRENGAEDKWLAVLRYGEQLFGTFYHAFDKPSAIEQTTATLDFERGRVILDGWLPERLRLCGLVSRAEADRLSTLLPAATASAWDGSAVWAHGRTVTPECRVAVEYSPGEKQALYTQAVQAALADFIAWTQDPAYQPCVTGAAGRAALATALQVRALAQRTAEQHRAA